MEVSRTIVLIDGDSRRRAAISHMLSISGTHIEPFESAAELTDRWPRADALLLHDAADRAIAGLLHNMGRSGRWLPVIAYAEAPSAGRIVDAIVEGALEYLAWPFNAAEFGATVTAAQARAASAGSARLRATMARSRIERLTRRERQVLYGVAGGLSNRMIGEKLAISPRTVEIHRANMLTKIGATHTSDAIRIAIEATILEGG